MKKFLLFILLQPSLLLHANEIKLDNSFQGSIVCTDHLGNESSPLFLFRDSIVERVHDRNGFENRTLPLDKIAYSNVEGVNSITFTSTSMIYSPSNILTDITTKIWILEERGGEYSLKASTLIYNDLGPKSKSLGDLHLTNFFNFYTYKDCKITEI
ncbi:TPA: hypothetical protein I7139_24625 [Vibrio vulnificus]|nr:hypothetical protein [Vibrio vulnificus]